MKRTILFLAVVSWTVKAQVVFAPPGAKWNYLFKDYNLCYYCTTTNEQIVSARDSVVAGDTVRVLTHKRFFMYFNNILPQVTVLRQTGDTIWFRNKKTNHSWQVLYNFAANVNDSWTVKLSAGSFSYQVKVVNKYDTIVNGMTLKKMKISLSAGNSPVRDVSITERLGAGPFIFYFPFEENSDGDVFLENLCYEDASLGLVKFSSLPCDFENPVSVGAFETSGYDKLMPNPASDQVSINGSGMTCTVSVSAITGEVLRSQPVQENQECIQIDISGLSPGVYIVRGERFGKIFTIGRLVKQ